MLSIATTALVALAAFSNVAVAAPQPALEQRQNSFNAIQNWANDFADVDFRNNAGGNFNVTWDNGFGGNFVVGKGYRPGRDM
jgi:endo-1,4-beta-xylanase